MSEPSAPAAPDVAPDVQVVRGEPSPEELAALVVVLAASGAGAGTDPPPARSLWAAGGRARTAYAPGPGAWRASALPR